METVLIPDCLTVSAPEGYTLYVNGTKVEGQARVTASDVITVAGPERQIWEHNPILDQK
jgi:hypothetical protein